MKRTICALGVLALLAAPVFADNIAFWNFNDQTQIPEIPTSLWRINPLGIPGAPTEYAADLGIGSASISTWGAGIAGNLVGINGGTESQNFGSYIGTTLNSINDPAVAGGSLSILGSDNNDRSFLIKLNDMLADCVLTYATRGTSTGYNTHIIDVSTDGGQTWSPFTSYASQQTSTWVVKTVNFGNFFDSGFDNIIRISVTGATSVNGNNRFDNILVTGTIVPEPAALLLLALGALTLRRR